MNAFQAFILGIMQGLAEFLPISSSGHLVLLQKLFKVNENAMTFDIAIHIATLIAVCIIYRQRIWNMVKNPFSKLPLYLVLGTLPIVILGFLFNDAIEGLFISGSLLGISFIITGIILWFSEHAISKVKKLEQMNIPDAIVIGTSQALAMFPGVSRAGMTIATGLSRGLDRKFAADFSFLLSIPAILGAAILDILKMVTSDTGITLGVEVLPLVIGMLAAGFTGYFAIKIMLRILSKGSLKYFSFYLWLLGLLILCDQLFLGKYFARLF